MDECCLATIHTHTHTRCHLELCSHVSHFYTKRCLEPYCSRTCSPFLFCVDIIWIGFALLVESCMGQEIRRMGLQGVRVYGSSWDPNDGRAPWPWPARKVTQKSKQNKESDDSNWLPTSIYFSASMMLSILIARLSDRVILFCSQVSQSHLALSECSLCPQLQLRRVVGAWLVPQYSPLLMPS
jgi:hypothetical protein